MFSKETKGVKSYWSKHLKAHDPFRRVTVKEYLENSTLSSVEKILEVKQLYNSLNDVVHVLKKMRKVKVLEERLICKTEVIQKQMMVCVAILKAGKTYFFCWAKHKGKFKVLLQSTVGENDSSNEHER